MSAQKMVGQVFDRPEDVVKHLLAMQAQDYAGALWSIGLRTKGCTKEDVEKAIAERKIVRTWPMRGTLHFMHADDVHWMVDLLAARATAAARSRRIDQLGLTDEVVKEAEEALRVELRGGKSIARKDVVTLLASKVKGVQITNQHTQHLMRNFGERGIICFGPHQGKQPTFVLLDEWVPRTEPKSREEALKELSERYFISHGPATLKDFSGWGMLTVSDAKRGLELAKSGLQTQEIDGTAYYMALDLQPAKKSETLLLPGFDEYLLGYKDRSATLLADHANKVVPGGNGMFLATIVKGGHVIGTWKKRPIKKLTIETSYFDSIDNDVDYRESLWRYEAFLVANT